MSKTWARRLDALATRQETRMKWRQRDLERLESRLEDVLKATANLKEKVDSDIEEFSASVEQLLERRRDPVVYVRNYGSYRHVYHSTLNCGWAPSSYETLLWSEAQDRNLRPCDSCGRAADAAARRIHEEEETSKKKAA